MKKVAVRGFFLLYLPIVYDVLFYDYLLLLYLFMIIFLFMMFTSIYDVYEVKQRFSNYIRKFSKNFNCVPAVQYTATGIKNYYITMPDYPFAYVLQGLSMPPLDHTPPYLDTSPTHDGHAPDCTKNPIS